MAQQPVEEKKASDVNVLMVVTNINTKTDKDGKVLAQTGWYLPEVAHPFAVFLKEGYNVSFGSIKGGDSEIDFESYTDWCDKAKDKECINFIDLIRASDANEMKRDDKPKIEAIKGISGLIGRDETGDEKDRKINKILISTSSMTSLQGKESEYDIVFFAGGYGPCWDFYDSNPDHDKASKKDTRDMHSFAAKVYENKDKPGVVAAVCHGPLALVNLKLSDGTFLVKDKKCAGFSNAEEKASGMSQHVPKSLQDGLIECGGKYSQSKELWQCHAVADSGLVTGQNPASASETGKLCVSELANIRKK